MKRTKLALNSNFSQDDFYLKEGVVEVVSTCQGFKLDNRSSPIQNLFHKRPFITYCPPRLFEVDMQ